MLKLDHFENRANAARHFVSPPPFARPAARPAKHFFLRQSGLRQYAARKLHHQVVNCFRSVIERRHHRHNHRARSLCAQHVFQVNAVQRRIAHAEKQLAAFFHHHIRRARHQIVASPARDGGQRADGAGNHDHRVHGITSRSDGRANILIRNGFDFLGGAPQDPPGKFFQVTRGDFQFFGEQPLARFRGHQVNLPHARIIFQQRKRLLRENSAAGSGHADGDDFGLCLSHGFCADINSLATAFCQVKHTRAAAGNVKMRIGQKT